MASSVTIDFNANLARFSSQIDKATNDLAKFETNAQRMAGNVKTIFAGLGIGLGVTALAGMVKQSISFADEMGKAAQKVGTTTEALSGLKYAGDLAGVSFEGLQTGMQKLARNADEAASGSKSAVEAFARIKLDPTQFKDTSDLFAAVAEKLSQLPDGAQKTAIAMDLLGKSGADLIPLLNGGADGLKRMADEAQAAGIVISGDAAKAAEQFNDNMLRMQEIGRGISQQLVNDLTPAMADISEAMLAAAKDGGILNGVWVALGGTMAHILGMDIASKTKARLDDINKQIAISQKQLAAGSLNPDGASDRFFNFLIPDVKLNPEAKRKLQSNLDSLLSERDQLLESLKPPKLPEKLNNFKVAPPVKAPKPGGKKGATKSVSDAQLQSQELATLIQNFQKAAEGPRSQSEDLQKTLDTYRALNPEVQTYLQGLIDQVAQRELLTKETEAWQRQQELAAYFDARELQAIEEVSAAEVAKTEAMERQALAIRELLDPQLKLLNMQQEYTALLDAGLLSQEEYSAALEKLAESQNDLAENGKTSLDDLKRAVEGFGKDAANAFVDFAFTGKASFGDMVESILKDLARLAIQRSITDPLIKGLDDSGIFSNFADGFKNIFGGARASGGPVASGKAYLVGERGPEIFMPSASGTIIPNGAGGGGMSVSVNVDASGSRAQGNGDQALAVGNAIGEAVRQELLRQRRPGGLLA